MAVKAIREGLRRGVVSGVIQDPNQRLRCADAPSQKPEIWWKRAAHLAVATPDWDPVGHPIWEAVDPMEQAMLHIPLYGH